MASKFESLPVELIADILGELDLRSLVTVSCLSTRLRHIAADPSINPWRRPILRNLRSGGPSEYSPAFRILGTLPTVPLHNWIDICTMARPEFLLFDAEKPMLPESYWEECYKKRFLPGWLLWRRKEDPWRRSFLKALQRVWHRTNTTCTSDEAWTKYIVLNRNGTANQLDATSRGFNPLHLFGEMKLQSNLAHLETRVRLVVQFADVRILAFGVLNKPRSTYTVNPNAKALLHPPGINKDRPRSTATSIAGLSIASRSNEYITHDVSSQASQKQASEVDSYTKLTRPLPLPTHENYPFYTRGGSDKRWFGSDEFEEEGRVWVGGLMIVAQLTSPQTHIASADGPPLQDMDLVIGPGRNQYASFTWADLAAIAPWMERRITKKIDGPGLRH